MIAIPNMEKPKNCLDCPVNDLACELWTEVVNIREHKHKDCPLIEIPDEIWEALKPKVETMKLAKEGWINNDSNTQYEQAEVV